MTEEQALLAACRATPADDLPRLVYADWLDEHGRSARASLIRHQCGDSATRVALVECTAEILPPDAGHELPGVLYRNSGFAWITSSKILGEEIIFRRGFAAEVRCRFNAWARHGDAFLPHVPELKVVLTTPPDGKILGGSLTPPSRPFGFIFAHDPDHVPIWMTEKEIQIALVNSPNRDRLLQLIGTEGGESLTRDIIHGGLRKRWPDVTDWAFEYTDYAATPSGTTS